MLVNVATSQNNVATVLLCYVALKNRRYESSRVTGITFTPVGLFIYSSYSSSPGGGLGTPKILSSGATLHLGPIRLHVENWKCDAIKSSAQCQKFGATCRFFSACKWSLTRRHIITIVLNDFQRINTNHCPSLEY